MTGGERRGGEGEGGKMEEETEWCECVYVCVCGVTMIGGSDGGSRVRE
jgi:hypothetical protein